MLVKTLGTLAIFYALLIGVAYYAQHFLTYLPDPKRIAPVSIGLREVTERTLATPDGEQVIYWYAAAKPGQPTLIYFHGNGSALANRAPRFAVYQSVGWGIAMMAYRGYGGSSGRPSEMANKSDAKQLYDALVRDGVPPASIVLYGESLGTGVATHVALTSPAAGLILESPYTSLPDAGAAQFWFMPVRWLMREKYDTAAIIGQIKMPVLVLHGARDRTIPVALGRRIAELAPDPKTYVEFPEGGHNDLYQPPNHAFQHVRKFVGSVVGK
ncbi:MAG: alpha/beta hydrolase [Hyphomicrobiaceae bacterium]|nr:alpha/beta hydrolase [Hyphomicrobiaceae bacterium]